MNEPKEWTNRKNGSMKPKAVPTCTLSTIAFIGLKTNMSLGPGPACIVNISPFAARVAWPSIHVVACPSVRVGPFNRLTEEKYLPLQVWPPPIIKNADSAVFESLQKKCPAAAAAGLQLCTASQRRDCTKCSGTVRNSAWVRTRDLDTGYND